MFKKEVKEVKKVKKVEVVVKEVSRKDIDEDHVEITFDDGSKQIVLM